MNKRAYSPGVMEEAFTSVTTITARRIEAVEDKVIGLQ